MKQVGSWIAGVAAVVFGCLAYAYLTLPDVRPLATKNPETTAFMELRRREAEAAGREPRTIQTWVSYNRISPHLKKAVLVAEDASFWDHDGVDYKELQKSIELDWAEGQFTRGASTITQQLAKNLYLSPSRNPLRKLRELIIARRLENELKKARILELYLNVIEWGDGIWGVEAAARAYFGASAASLGPTESALLAGAIINPRVLTPAKPTARLLRRQQIILGRMGRVVPPPAVESTERSDKPEIDPESSPGEATPSSSDAASPEHSDDEKRADESEKSEPAEELPPPPPLDARPVPFPGLH
jgi:monofunctional biosynthetic peptidoglycan transglycosylase